MSESTGPVTTLLMRVKSGDASAMSELLPLVYNELRRIAGHYMCGERAGHTLQATAVVHEAYMRLIGLDHIDWRNRAQFMGVAAQMMRRILINHARDRIAAKRGGNAVVNNLVEVEAATCDRPEEVLAVDEAITRLSQLNREQARLIELRYFGGMSVEETAEALGISTRTVKRQWAMAKAWLHAELSGHKMI